MGHVQDTPVSTNMISNECMIYLMKVHTFSYDWGPKKFQNVKIHILTIYEQMNHKTAIVTQYRNSTILRIDCVEIENLLNEDSL